MSPQDRTAERKIAGIARRQHGVVTRRQLLAAGITSDQIRWRTGTGALLQEHPGVYRVGHRAPSVHARYLAAVFACGEGAVLSGRAAAHLYGLLKGAAPPPEVTSTTERRVNGVSTRRTRHLDPHDTTTYHGIPTTTVPRTLVDLAATLTAAVLARACHEAQVKHRTNPAQVEAVLRRRPNAPGATILKAVLRGDVHISLSILERAFVDLLDAHGLPRPVTNRPAGTKRVDARWPGHHLTVELDSYRYHHTRLAWEQDRERERDAHARGDQHRRYVWTDVTARPGRLLAELRDLLA